MDIALERELEDGEDEEIVKTEGGNKEDDDGDENGKGDGGKKGKDAFSDLFDPEDPELKQEIDELCHEEEDMLKVKNNDEEDELAEPEAGENKGAVAAGDTVAIGNASATG